MIVAIDVDSTLYDAASLFSRVAKDHFEIDLPMESTNWHDYHNHAPLDILLRIFRKAHSKEYVQHNTPYPMSVEVVQMIADRGHQVYFVSDRHPQAKGPLADWLHTNGFPARDDYLQEPYPRVVAGKDKRSWLMNTRPQIVIDDRVRTILFAKATLEAKVFSLQHSWNVNLKNEIEDVHICEDWEEIGRKIEEIL